MLQAMILVAVYERGHGIYPAAYLNETTVTVSTRSMNVDWPNRALCTLDPTENYYLPVLDDDWNNGTYPNVLPYTVSSPCAEKMGKFARLAQAAHLLSRVLRHVSGTEIGRNLLREERNTLGRAIRSLLSLTVSEEELCGVVYCSPVAVLGSAFLMLQSFHRPIDEVPSHAEAEDRFLTAMERTAEVILPIAHRLLCGHIY
ncbi:hypothetical protein BDV33DRAFT_196300 [Aspergillus novoparasiticus]|uniref:Transcription factor domain-containing protein n=1 Tax=Aspergillus novoparasiticus TaxID=986946 RepID=A0A5N6EBN3_9EURO|nr:hypothetical protein BDV33DRAFT_196300 [Aspergillus novoparasiticus]